MKTCWLVILLSLLTLLLKAQQVNVSLILPPPYPIHLEDYVDMPDNAVLTVTNLSGTVKQVKLIPTVTNALGLSAQVKNSFVPSSPLELQPFETKILNGIQLQLLNGNITEEDVQLNGFNIQQIIHTETLPEGNYTVCIQVYDYNTNELLSGVFGCTPVLLTHYDPPIIINPVHQSTVPTFTPQFINFSWTPTGMGGITRYKLELVDLTQSGLFNPNDAFSGLVLPYFETENILPSIYSYSIADPPLITGHQYAVRVTAYDPNNSISFKNGGKSEVITFVYGNNNEQNENNNPEEEDENIVIDPNDQEQNQDQNQNQNQDQNQNQVEDPMDGACVASCTYAGPMGGNANQGAFPNGTDIKVGLFVMKNTVFSQNGASYSGTGNILVNFLNTRIKVKFDNIKINADQRMYEGKITAVIDNNSLVNEALATTTNGVVEELPNPDQLNTYINQANRLVSQINPEAPAIGVPLGFDHLDHTIGIAGIIFEPTTAYINSIMGSEVPQSFAGGFLTFGTKGIQVHPNGFGIDAIKLALVKDKTVILAQGKASLKFLGGADKTFVTMSCQGFKNISVSGEWILDRNVALPLDANGQVIEGLEQVKAPFNVSAALGLGQFVISATLNHDFTVPETKGFIFKGSEIVFDFSEVQNATGFNAAFPSKSDPTWVGLYIKKIGVVLPKGFKKNGGNMSFEVNHFRVDKMGVSGGFVANNILDANQGSTAGWKFSIAELKLTLESSELTSGSMKGEILLPINGSTGLAYSAGIHGGNDGAGFDFSVSTLDDIEAKLWLAQIKLFQGSTLELLKDGENAFKANAILNGEISINFGGDSPNGTPENTNISKLNIPKLKFQELSIDGKDAPGFIPNMDFAFVELESQNSPQITIEGFELGLTKLGFKKGNNNKDVGLELGMSIGLFGNDDNANGVSANTDFTIWADFDVNTKKFDYKNAQLNSLTIDADLGAASIYGSVTIYNEDVTFGNGFRGELEAEVKGVGVKVGAIIQFGKTLPNKGNYKYWYFDIMADLGNIGFNIPGTAASIYGFGGSAWCNMSMTDNIGVKSMGTYTQAGNYNASNPGSTRSGNTVLPQKGLIGFKASLVFGLTGTKEAFNGDVTFTMTMDIEDLSINLLRLQGNAYVMQDPTDRESSIIHCSADIKIEPQQKLFHGNFGLEINLYNIITGSGSIDLFFKGAVNPGDKGLWHIKIGYWTNEEQWINNPFDDPGRVKASIKIELGKILQAGVKFQCYFMVGNDLPDGLPPLPDYVLDIVNSNEDYDYNAPAQQSLGDELSNTDMLGIALGAGFKVYASLEFLFLYADFNAEMCFDISLLNYGNVTCSGSEGDQVGFNGWYAQGQAYAYLHGEAGLFVKLFGYEGKLALISLTAGAVLEAKLPNPYWFRGRFGIEGSALGGLIKLKKRSFEFEIGEKCDIVADVNPFEDIEMISDIKPYNGQKNVDVFTDPQVAFNIPEGFYNAFEIQVPGEEEPVEFYMTATYEMYTGAGNSKKLVKGQWTWDDNRSAIRFRPEDLLEATTVYTISVVAKGFQKGVFAPKETQTKTITFTSGKRPEVIVMKNVFSTNPYPNQRYFMKQSTTGGASEGVIKMSKSQCYLFEGLSVGPQIGDKMVARFTELTTGKNYDVPCTCNDGAKWVNFTVPVDLKNEEIYKLSIVRKIGAVKAAPAPVNTQTAYQDMGDNLSAKIQTISANATSDKPWEKIIFDNINFKTSKFNNMSQKLNSYASKKTGYFNWGTGYVKGGTNADNYENPVILMQGGENFDNYDLYGYSVNIMGESHTEPAIILPLSDDPMNDWQNQMKLKYYEFYPSLGGSHQAFMTQHHGPIAFQRPGGFPFYGCYDNQHNSYHEMSFMHYYDYYEDVLRDKGYIGHNEHLIRPSGQLTPDEINEAKGENQPVNINNFVINQPNQQGNGLNNMNLNITLGQGYFPVMALHNYVSHTDKFNTDMRILNEAAKISPAKLTAVFNAIKALGWPTLKNGNYQLRMYYKEFKHINGSQSFDKFYPYTVTKG